MMKVFGSVARAKQLEDGTYKMRNPARQLDLLPLDQDIQIAFLQSVFMQQFDGNCVRRIVYSGIWDVETMFWCASWVYLRSLSSCFLDSF